MRPRLRIVAVALLFALLTPSARAGDDAPGPEDAVARSARDLGAEDLDTRRKAAFALWNAGTQARPHVRALASALRDEDDYVRNTVEKVLVRFEWQRSLNTLTSALPELIDALGDERASVRLAAVNLIWNAGPIPNVVGGDPAPKTLLPALVGALSDEDARVRANAAASLANLQKNAVDALPALKKAVRDADPGVRMWTIRALGWIDAEQGLPVILTLSDDADAGVRTAVFEAAGGAPTALSDAALAKLHVGLQDAVAGARTAAINALWQLGRTEAVPALVRVLQKDEDPAVRSRAAMALGGLGDPAAVPHLRAALDGSDDTVLAGAASGLARLGPEGAVAVARMVELLETGSNQLRQSIALSMGMLGRWAEPALPALVASLKHEDASVRSMAASSLSGLVTRGVQSEDLRAAVLAGLRDSAPQVRQYCIAMTMNLGPAMQAAVPTLLALHADGAEHVGERAVFTALGKIGPAAKAALPMLRKAVAGSGYDRLSAATAIALIAESPKEVDGAVQVLIDALAYKKTRFDALYQLKSVGPRARRAALIMRVWMQTEVWRLQAAGVLLSIGHEYTEDAAALLGSGLEAGGEEAGRAMRQVADLGVRARPLRPALLAHAQDPASTWRTGALMALIGMQARGDDVRAAYAAARKDKGAYLRTLGALGLESLEGDAR